MDINKKIISFCPNFYQIINYEFNKDDEITSKLIKVYEQFIFSIDINNSKDIELIKELDKVMAKYMDNYFFRKQMRKDIMEIRTEKKENLLLSIVEGIIQINQNFEQGITRKIYISRWI